MLSCFFERGVSKGRCVGGCGFLLLLLFYLPANGAVSGIGTSLFEHCFGVGDGEADVVGFGGYADVAGDEGVEVEVEGLGGGCECGEGGEKLFGGEHGCSFFFLVVVLLVVLVASGGDVVIVVVVLL